MIIHSNIYKKFKNTINTDYIVANGLDIYVYVYVMYD
jgi:hypothetical protein